MSRSHLILGLVVVLVASLSVALYRMAFTEPERSPQVEEPERKVRKRPPRIIKRRPVAPPKEETKAQDPGEAAEDADAPGSNEKSAEELIAEGEMAELTLELVRAKEQEDRTITVSVFDEASDPILDALVVIRSRGEIIFRDRADSDGVVEFEPYEEEEGPFRIDVIADEFSPGSVEEVRPGATERFVLQAQAWVEGVVDAPSKGHGVVTLFTRNGRRTTTPEADGSFYFGGLDPGSVTVQASVDPYGVDSETIQVIAGRGQFVRLRVRLKNRVRVFGRIKGWPRPNIPGSKVWINGVPVNVTQNGTYIFKKAILGLNEFVADVPTKALKQERFFIKGRQSSEYNFALEAEAFLRGTVFAIADRARLEGAEVRIGVDYDDPLNDEAPLFPIRKVPLAFTNDEGKFTIGKLQPGMQYVLSVVKEPHAHFTGSFTAKSLGQHRIGLASEPYLFGKLRGIGGVPRNARIRAYRLLEQPDRRRFNVERWDHVSSGRDVKGFYGLSGLMPDLYVIRAEAPGFGAMETIVDLRGFGAGRMDLRLRKGEFQTSADAELLKRLPPVIYDDEELPPEERDNRTILKIDVKRPPASVPFPGVRIRFFEGEMEYTAPVSFTGDSYELVGLEEASYRATLTHGLLEKPIVVEGVIVRRGEPFQLRFRESE
ncbi:MAG: carboxypeptidase-like regulatory domain-containing protein [Planctomycetota bacterium]